MPKPVVEELDLPPRLACVETNLSRSRAMSSERRAVELLLDSMNTFRGGFKGNGSKTDAAEQGRPCDPGASSGAAKNLKG